MANEPELPVGTGRFGSLLDAAMTLLQAAWRPRQPLEQEEHHTGQKDELNGEGV